MIINTQEKFLPISSRKEKCRNLNEKNRTLMLTFQNKKGRNIVKSIQCLLTIQMQETQIR